MGEREQYGNYANSPIAARLRAGAKKQAPRQKESVSEKKNHFPRGRRKTEKSGDKKRKESYPTASIVNLPIMSKTNMDDLYKHLSELHGNTEKSMKDMVDSCKKEINGIS